MDVQGVTYPGRSYPDHSSPTDQGLSCNPCEMVASAVYYLLGKLRRISVDEGLLASRVEHVENGVSVSLELWGTPRGKSLYMRKCGLTEVRKHQLKMEKALLREAQGPNIVRLIESDDDTLLMPDAGRSLYEKFIHSKEALSQPEFETYARQLMKGVAHLHDSGIWHLDLKLDNLIVDDEHNLSIIDFGLSQYAGPSENLEVCTKGYKPPEMFYEGPEAISSKTDVFSAGVCLFRLLTCKKLFPDKFDQNKMMNQHTYYEHLNLQLKKVAHIDKRYVALLKSMLAWNPKHRPDAGKVLSYFMKT
ncbi:protein kinase [Endozoicomonas sp. ISHI1]|uniref:protein kinase domain-containing protein n=1 Tax=Endozoicomonas sp. ISHI1 TaxID=2825882 RepID=UPI0021489B6A|nr:protein kinase [Endozoicomonas sp. ISHI1]